MELIFFSKDINFTSLFILYALCRCSFLTRLKTSPMCSEASSRLVTQTYDKIDSVTRRRLEVNPPLWGVTTKTWRTDFLQECSKYAIWKIRITYHTLQNNIGYKSKKIWKQMSKSYCFVTSCGMEIACLLYCHSLCTLPKDLLILEWNASVGYSLDNTLSHPFVCCPSWNQNTQHEAIKSVKESRNAWWHKSTYQINHILTTYHVQKTNHMLVLAMLFQMFLSKW